MHAERALIFDCGGETLVGVVSAPQAADAVAADTGVLIVVGGPQYRVGSHRQFVMLARFLADNGVPCMRFDFRGMGDASGEARDFEALSDDIEAAIAAFARELPGLRRIVLWGLCDGASAICLSLGGNPLVAGAVLLNPWVRTAETQARTMLKHYYLQRLLDPRFWRKLLGGGVNLRGALGGVKEAAGAAAGAGSVPSDREGPLPKRMLRGLQRCELPVAVFLSGRDYVAREFEQCVAGDAAWGAFMASGRCSVRHFAEADHTFSAVAQSDGVARATLEWVRGLP
ncbi:MAG: hydrolase 1, exosortase A system-associated [Rhodocyclaceae bacterium]|jgi:exosortase A-associated hydrolase 1|nr:hydrolase 1, exosortase A system-associated [Thauera sp.]RTL28402.1 MAG: hydrolase 1, exosortase A system-associated [Rhodocyclaceae bacterium]